MWSGAWNKRKLTSDISNRFLASPVSRAWDWWSGGCGFKPRWGQFLTKFILCCVTLDLSDNLTEIRLKGLTWKTQLFLCLVFIVREQCASEASLKTLQTSYAITDWFPDKTKWPSTEMSLIPHSHLHHMKYSFTKMPYCALRLQMLGICLVRNDSFAKKLIAINLCATQCPWWAILFPFFLATAMELQWFQYSYLASKIFTLRSRV